MNSALTYSFSPQRRECMGAQFTTAPVALPRQLGEVQWRNRQLLPASPCSQCLAQTAIFTDKFACRLVSINELYKGFSSVP